MLRGAAARRFAEAVFALALEGERAPGSGRAGLDRWQADLDVIADAVSNRELKDFLERPGISLGQRRDVLERVLKAYVSQEALHLAYVLLERGRIDLAPAVAREYKSLVEAHRGIQEADVTTAVPLTADERTAVVARLEQMTGKRIVLREHVDRSILGGIVLRVGDTLIDDSVVHRLAEMRERLTSGRRGTQHGSTG